MKKEGWLWWYQSLAKGHREGNWRYMNYGFSDPNAHPIPLEEEDEIDRPLIQLYHHTATQHNIEGLRVLEVGCGRGGGASYVARYLNPSSVVGLDLSPQAISLCEDFHHHISNLSFVQGDAEDLPFDDASFDVVLNVESSHCYPHMDRFLSEVQRVLRPGGRFLYCDLRLNGALPQLEEALARINLESVQREDITPHILNALDGINERKEGAITSYVPPFFRNAFRAFSATKGTFVYKALTDGSGIYISCMLQKKNH